MANPDREKFDVVGRVVADIWNFSPWFWRLVLWLLGIYVVMRGLWG